jgi:hypothetical protein
MLRACLTLASIAILAACAGPTDKTPIPITPPQDAADASVVRRPLEQAAPPAAGAPSTTAPSVTASPANIPSDAIYVCVSQVNGLRQQTVIEFAPKVYKMCKRHPEMGPCQYERNLCRRSGGRVYAADGREITLATETEYDKKVMRVRFRAD